MIGLSSVSVRGVVVGVSSPPSPPFILLLKGDSYVVRFGFDTGVVKVEGGGGGGAGGGAGGGRGGGRGREGEMVDIPFVPVTMSVILFSDGSCCCCFCFFPLLLPRKEKEDRKEENDEFCCFCCRAAALGPPSSCWFVVAVVVGSVE